MTIDPIDADKLEAALIRAEDRRSRMEDLPLIVAAARAHLAQIRGGGVRVSPKMEAAIIAKTLALWQTVNGDYCFNFRTGVEWGVSAAINAISQPPAEKE